MSPPRDSNSPEEVERESTASVREAMRERIARLEAELAALREHAPSKDWVDSMVTGLRHSIRAEIVGLPTKDRIEAIVTDVNMLATKESVDTLRLRMDNLGLPKFWQMILLAGVLVSFVGGVVWKAHDEVSELRERAHVLEVQREGLDARLKQQEGLTMSLIMRHP